MAFGNKLFLATASVFLLAQVAVISGQSSYKMLVTFSIEKKWYGGFLGRFRLNFTENADYWLFDVTFPRNIFELKTSGGVAKVGKENHRSYRFADLPWSRHVDQGDVLEVVFYAKTWKEVRGLKANVTYVKTYHERPCLQTCEPLRINTHAIYDGWQKRQLTLAVNSGHNVYEFNDYLTAVLSSQGATASAPLSGVWMLEENYRLNAFGVNEFTYRSTAKMVHLGDARFREEFATSTASGILLLYVSGTDACSCFTDAIL